MTVEQARSRVILFSMFATAGVLLFVWVAEGLFGFPLDEDDTTRLMQIVVPVFLGYLGTASHFAFKESDPADLAGESELKPSAVQLVRWPLVLWVVLAGVALGMFGWTNRVVAPPGTGWTVDQLAAGLTMSMALLAATTGVAVSFLFSPKAKNQPGKPDAADGPSP